MNSKRVVFPDELLENTVIETTIFTEHNDVYGIAALSEEGEGSTPFLRLYQLIWFNDEEVFSPVQQLEAFGFLNRGDLDDFLTRLPNMTGLEMLLLLNPASAFFIEAKITNPESQITGILTIAPIKLIAICGRFSPTILNTTSAI